MNIKGDRPLDYKLNAKLNGYVDFSKYGNKNNREEFLHKAVHIGL